MQGTTGLNRIIANIPPREEVYTGALVNLADVPQYIQTGYPRVPLTMFFDGLHHLILSADIPPALLVDPNGLAPLDACLMPSGALVFMAVGTWGLYSLDKYLNAYPGLPDSESSFNQMYLGIV